MSKQVTIRIPTDMLADLESVAESSRQSLAGLVITTMHYGMPRLRSIHGLGQPASNMVTSKPTNTTVATKPATPTAATTPAPKAKPGPKPCLEPNFHGKYYHGVVVMGNVKMMARMPLSPLEQEAHDFTKNWKTAKPSHDLQKILEADRSYERGEPPVGVKMLDDGTVVTFDEYDDVFDDDLDEEQA